MKTLVVYGGRFQPPHLGHKASYDHLAKKYGGNVYMASAEKAPGPDDPFSWDEKKALAVSLGVPSDKFVKVKNAYVEKFIQEAIPFNPDDTVLILAVSEKDGDRLIGKNTDKEGYALKKDGNRAAIQWLRDNPGPVSAGHVWAVITPTVEFKVMGKGVKGATQIREMYRQADEKQRLAILADLYGKDKVSKKMKDLFDERLTDGVTEDFVLEFAQFLSKF